MKKLVLCSLMIAGSSYAMDPTNPKIHNQARAIAQSGELDRDQAEKRSADDISHSKFCMEACYSSSQECRCKFPRIRSAEQITNILKQLTSSKE